MSAKAFIKQHLTDSLHEENSVCISEVTTESTLEKANGNCGTGGFEFF